MNILVTGSNGQLGSEIKDIASNYKQFNFFFTDSSTLNICNKSQLDLFFIEKKINTVINCAAYTDVDKAEEDELIAQKINYEGVSNLVNVLQKVDGKLIHISTDYVFDGNSFLPYKELDKVNPIGVYGNTKRKGELAVINSDIDGIVIRTSWLYSVHGNNFVNMMIKLGNEKDELGVIFDQVGSPTNASDLAKTCIDILDYNKKVNINSKGNLYHFSNEGVASWYDFSKTIMALCEIDCYIKPIETKDYHTAAKRPHFSVLNKSKIKKDFEITILHWIDSLAVCIKKINNK